MLYNFKLKHIKSNNKREAVSSQILILKKHNFILFGKIFIDTSKRLQMHVL